MRKLKLFVAACALAAGSMSTAWAQGTWTAPAIPGSDIATTNTGNYAIYNIKADAFMGEGMNYGTEAIACRAEGGYSAALAARQKFTLTVNGSTVKMVHANHTDRGVGCASTNANDIYADYASNNVWTFAASSNYANAYTLTLSGYGTLDVDDKWGGKLTIKDGKGYTDWAFIPEGSLTDGSFAKWMERKAMYGVYEALVASGTTTTYASALETANTVYANSSATVAELRAATRALIIATADGIQQPTDVSALFTNANMQQDGTADWSSTGVTRSGGAIEVYHAAITLTQSKNDVPNGLYTVIFRGMQRQDGSDAAPVFKAESGSNVLTTNVPFMTDLASRWNVRSGSNWAGTNGSQIPDRLWRAAEGLAYEGASVKMENFKVTGNTLALTVTQSSTSQWFTFNSFEIIYNGPVNLALYNQIVAAKETAEGLLSSAMNATVKTALNNAINGAEGLTANSEEEALNTALTALNTAIGNANTSIAVYSEISALTAKLQTQDATFNVDEKFNAGTYTAVSEVIADYYAHEISQFGTEANTDITKVIINPSFEYGANDFSGWTNTGMVTQSNESFGKTGTYYAESWQPDGTKSVKQTISGMPAGVYRLTAKAKARGVTSAKLFAGGVETAITVADSETEYSVEFACDANADIEIGFEGVGTGAGSSWLCVDNFTMTLVSAGLPDVTAVEGKMNNDVAAAQTAAIAAYNADKTVANYNAASAAIAAAQASVNAYAAANAAIVKAEAIIVETNVFVDDKKTAYQTAIDNAKTAYNAGTMEDVTASGLEDALNGGTIYKPTTPMRDFYGNAWTATNSVSIYTNSWSTEGNSDGSNFTTPFIEDWVSDANTLANTTISASVAGLQTGTYKVTATVRMRLSNSGTAPVNGLSLQVNEGEPVAVSGEKNFGDFYVTEVEAIGYVANEGDVLGISFIVDGTNASWLGIKAVNYERTGDVPAADANDYAALNSAITAAEAMTLGFENGEYAPYNNVDAIVALNAAKAINQNVNNVKSVVTAATNALTAATWTANTAEVNAIYDGDFTNAPVANATAGVNGWSAAEGLRQLVKSTVEGSIVSTGMYVWGSNTVTYGETVGYTLPLKANTVYKLTFDRASWSGGSSSHTDVSIIDPDGTDLGKAVEDGHAGDWNTTNGTLLSRTMYFVTTTAGDYTLKLTPWGNSVYTNMKLFTTTDALDFADGAVPSYVPGTYPAVKISRTLTAGNWATAVYPFAVSGVEKIAVVDSYDKTNGELKFKGATASEANVPFLMRSNVGVTEISLSDVAVEAAAAQNAVASEVSLIGVYAETNITNAEKNYVLSQNKIYSVGEAGAIIPVYRAYLQVEQPAGEGARTLSFTVDGETTAIEGVATEGQQNGAVYNLNGQRVEKAAKGLYIQNGKKVVLK